MSLKLIEMREGSKAAFPEEKKEEEEIMLKTENHPLKQAVCLDYLKLKSNLEKALRGLSLEKRAEAMRREVLIEVRKVKPLACVDQLGEEGESPVGLRLQILASECIDQIESLQNKPNEITPREMVDLTQLLSKKMEAFENLKKEATKKGEQYLPVRESEEDTKELVEGLIEKSMKFSVGDPYYLYLPNYEAHTLAIYSLKDKTVKEVEIPHNSKYEWQAMAHVNQYLFIAGNNWLSRVSP